MDDILKVFLVISFCFNDGGVSLAVSKKGKSSTKNDVFYIKYLSTEKSKQYHFNIVNYFERTECKIISYSPVLLAKLSLVH